jgi:hypothetical protein
VTEVEDRTMKEIFRKNVPPMTRFKFRPDAAWCLALHEKVDKLVRDKKGGGQWRMWHVLPGGRLGWADRGDVVLVSEEDYAAIRIP